jgi:hypothetical protein
VGKKLAGDYNQKAATYLQESRENSRLWGHLTLKSLICCQYYMGVPRANFNPDQMWIQGKCPPGRGQDNSLPGFVSLCVALQFLLQKLPELLFFQFTHFSVVGELQFVDLRS